MMSPRGSKSSETIEAKRGVVVEKPKANIYTVLLALSFIAVVIACVFLSLEMSAYDWQFKAR
jgi:hypothetical protein